MMLWEYEKQNIIIWNGIVRKLDFMPRMEQVVIDR